MDDWTELINIQYQAKKLSMYVIAPRALKPIRTEEKKRDQIFNDLIQVNNYEIVITFFTSAIT